MSDADELEDIRERKREQLEAKLRGDTTDEQDRDVAAAPSEPIHIEDGDHLQEVTAKYDVVLVDFYADWCGPCKMLEPIVESLAAETDAAVAKVDIDANQMLAGQYNVRGVPTLVLFAGGDPVEQLVGVKEKDTLANLIAQHS